MSTTRMYLVTSDFGSKHLVEAASQAQAIRAVVGPRFEATIPSNKEVVALMRDGVEVLETDESDEPETPPILSAVAG